MFFAACHSVLFCVGGMEQSDSESDFELHEVDPVVDGFSDDFSQTTSEEQQERSYPGFVRVVFPCTGLKGVQILAKHSISLGGYTYWGGINIGGVINFWGWSKTCAVRCAPLGLLCPLKLCQQGKGGAGGEGHSRGGGLRAGIT